MTEKPKKKIALCISGYMRTFKDCYPSILENLIQDNDVDIFIHTYDKVGNSSGWRSPIDLSEDVYLDFLFSIPYVKTIVTEKWDDIKYKFEKFKELHPFITNISTIATVLYKIYKCNELKKDYEKEHNFTYDLVIRMRGDQMFTKKVNLDFPENKILINAYPWGDEDYVHNYQPLDENGNADGSENYALNDRFAVGSSANIDYLTDLYNHFEEYTRDLEIRSPLEQLLCIHLKPLELEKRNLFFYVKHFPPRMEVPE